MTIKDKLKNGYSETIAIAKLQPIIFATMLFNIIYGLAATIISMAELSFYIGIFGAYSLIFGIAKFYALRKYRAAALLGNENAAVREIENNSAKNMATYGAVMSFLVFSFAIVCTFFFEENPKNYGLWFVYFVAASAFIKVILAVFESIRTRKNHNIIIHHIKRLSLANALIALGLTQRALLYFFDDANARWASGVGGIVFSLLALAVCMTMFLKYR
jgi:magnesium-transporting ATPase (P-type)